MHEDSPFPPASPAPGDPVEGSVPVDLNLLAVRAAERADIVHVHQLTATFYQDSVNPRRYPWADAIERDATACGFAACVGESVLGYAVLRVRGAEAELCYLLVAPQYRKHGVGRRLLQAAVSHLKAQGCARLECWAMAANEPALRVYRQAGLKPYRHILRADLTQL